MPLSKYDPLFGGDAAKAHAALVKQYGKEKGERVFYGLVNKRKKRRKGNALSDALKHR